MKTLQNLYRQFPVAGLILLGVGICIWAYTIVFLIVLISLACTT